MAAATDPETLRLRLWETLEDMRIGMLAANPANHMQPMTAFAEPQRGRLYFFTRDDTDLVRDLGPPPQQAHFVLISRDHSFRACVRGALTIERDESRMRKFWNPVVSAWYPEGLDDPRLTLLAFDIADADIWVSDKGPLKFALEIAKANLTGDEPDVGGRATVKIGEELLRDRR